MQCGVKHSHYYNVGFEVAASAFGSKPDAECKQNVAFLEYTESLLSESAYKYINKNQVSIIQKQHLICYTVTLWYPTESMK